MSAFPAALLFLPAAAQAAEWPQWGGPHRNFHTESRGLPTSMAAGGPRVLWRRPPGSGHSSVLVDGDRLYTMYRKSESEALIAPAADSGKTLWEYVYPAPFLKGMHMDVGPGPHATPLLAGNRVFTVGVTGKLHCLDKKTGQVLWQRGLLEEDGQLALVTLSPKGLEVHWQFPLLENKAWTPPSLVGSRLYARDRKSILALDFTKR